MFSLIIPVYNKTVVNVKCFEYLNNQPVEYFLAEYNKGYCYLIKVLVIYDVLSKLQSIDCLVDNIVNTY